MPRVAEKTVRGGRRSPMWIGGWSLLALTLVVGCSSMGGPAPMWQSQNLRINNPVFLAATDPHTTWEAVVDVIDDYFEIERERPVQVLDTMLTEGRIDTHPIAGATVFEPWYADSVGLQERTESTLQSIRRKALVRVIPADGGYLVEVIVYKELEIVNRPPHSSAGSAMFRFDTNDARVAEPTPEEPVAAGWVPLGRDHKLEQRIIQQLVDTVHPI